MRVSLNPSLTLLYQPTSCRSDLKCLTKHIFTEGAKYRPMFMIGWTEQQNPASFRWWNGTLHCHGHSVSSGNPQFNLYRERLCHSKVDVLYYKWTCPPLRMLLTKVYRKDCDTMLLTPGLLLNTFTFCRLKHICPKSETTMSLNWNKFQALQNC